MILNIREEFNQVFLEYRLDSQDEIDTFCEGMLKNNKIIGVIPLNFQQIDNQKLYTYNITNFISLEQYIKNQMSKDEVVNILIQILKVFNDINEYMIENRYILLNSQYIFIDDNKKIHMIGLPIEQIKESQEIGQFIKQLLVSINYKVNENSNYVANILNYINKRQTISLSETIAFLKKILKTNEESYSNIPPKRVSKIKAQPKQEKIVGINVVPNIEKKQFQSVMNENVKQSHQSKESVIPKMSSQGSSINGINKVTSKRRDKIPTLKKNRAILNNQVLINQELKVKTKVKNKPKKQTNNKIPKSSNGIPTLNKRKSPDVKEVNIGSSLNENIKSKYSGDIKSEIFEGTTVLGSDEGTTVLSEGTVVLDEIGDSIRYPTITRMKNNQKIEIRKSVFNIGKDATSNDFIVSDNVTISRKHAQIIFKNGRYYLSDLNSTNKTYIDGKIVNPKEEIEIQSGSLIRLANEEFIFEL